MLLSSGSANVLHEHMLGRKHILLMDWVGLVSAVETYVKELCVIALHTVLRSDTKTVQVSALGASKHLMSLMNGAGE